MAQAAEGDLRGPVSLDHAHQPARGHGEDAAARGAVPDGRVGLHPVLDAGILLVELELADDPRRDAQGAAVRRADHHHVVADVHVVVCGDLHRVERLALDHQQRRDPHPAPCPRRRHAP